MPTKIVDGLADDERRETFEKDQGFRMHFGGRSILHQALSSGSKMTPRQRGQLTMALRTYMDGVEERTSVSRGSVRALSAADFPEISEPTFYRFVTSETLNYMKNGSFQFGTPRRYREMEDQGRADHLEARATMFFEDEERSLTLTGITGFNTVMLCGTSHPPRDRRRISQLRAQFGSHLIEIVDLRAFQELAAESLGASRVLLRDVQYENAKMMVLPTPDLGDWLSVLGTGDLTDEKLHQLNLQFSPRIYEALLLPSLFAKPRRYAHERERRLLFEFELDQNEPFRTVSIPDAVKLVRIVD